MPLLSLESVISGWEIGVASMKKGEVCKLIIHPEFGYGTDGSRKIPGNATLIFEVRISNFLGKIYIVIFP